MAYTEVSVRFNKGQFKQWYDLLIADLMLQDFEGFAESESTLLCYIPSDLLNKKQFEQFVSDWAARNIGFTWSMSQMEDKNWNEIWEKSFQPVTIKNKCQVLAPFHKPDSNIPLHIILEPKMAFGTGHHETTCLMLEELLDLSPEGERILDLGCGTGILSILAAKLGAEHIVAVDNDPIAINRCKENLSHNNIFGVEVQHGTIQSIVDQKYDLILANISKMVILKEILQHSHLLSESGSLLLSGFYEEDFEEIYLKATKNSLKLSNKQMRNNWVMTRFIKSPDR